MPVLVIDCTLSPPSAVYPTHLHHKINFVKCHPIMSLCSKRHGHSRARILRGIEEPLYSGSILRRQPYFSVLSDKEVSALPSGSSGSLQQGILLPFSKSLFAQTVLSPRTSFSLLSPDWLNSVLPSRTSSNPACSARPSQDCSLINFFLNLVSFDSLSNEFIWFLE